MTKLNWKIKIILVALIFFKVSAASTLRGGGSDVPEEQKLTTQSIKREEINSPETVSLSAFIDIVITDGFWGNWGEMVVCPANYNVCGIATRLERPQGGGDDTAMNGLAMRCCHSQYGSWTYDVMVGTGIWGDWSGYVMCPRYLSGARVIGVSGRLEPQQGGGDDTAFNGIQVICETKIDANRTDGETVMIQNGYWGDWLEMKRCPVDMPNVCGFRYRFEPSQGGGDDTGMNGLTMRCCSA